MVRRGNQKWSDVIRNGQKWSYVIRSDEKWSEVIIRMVRMMTIEYLRATICDHAVRLLRILLCKTHLLQQLGLLLPRCNIFLLIQMVYLVSSIPYRLAFPAPKILHIYEFTYLHSFQIYWLERWDAQGVFLAGEKQMSLCSGEIICLDSSYGTNRVPWQFGGER